MKLAGPRRSHPNDDENIVPVELPHVLVTVAADGTLTATVGGTPFPTPGETAWTRTTFGPLMDAITNDRTVAVRVEVRECDGSVFTDIIRPRTPRRAAPAQRRPVTAAARALIDLDILPDTTGQEVILLGRISGTIAVRRLT